MARIWITGIAGLIGSHLADVLLAEGHEVEGTDNLICGDKNNSPVCNYNIDCCDFDQMKEVLGLFRPDILVHCAATASEGFSVFSPSFITRNIYEASVATFSAAISVGVKRIVYFSSMARYGKGNPPFSEDDTTNPVDPYGIAKVAAEQTLVSLCNAHGVKWSICVPHNVAGPRQEVSAYRNVISIFLNRLHYDSPVYIYGDGEQKRCFSPIKDCLHSLKKIVNGGADGEIVNIGPDGGEITINELLSICEEVTGKKAERIYLDARPVTDDVKEAYCSSNKARRLLDYYPQQKLKDCIQEMWDNFKPKPFDYSFPLEINNDKVPLTWKNKLK